MWMWMKRVFLFMAVNALVMLTLSAIVNLLGIRPYLSRGGIDYGMLMAFCLVWGMGGAFISLLISRMMAKWTMGVRLIDERSTDAQSRWLLQIVHRLSQSAGLPTMPEVGIYESPEVNAFATGPSKSRSLVAVSSGLLEKMDKQAIEGVLGHEISHIANGDMVTMTLLQGVVNAFVMFLARAIAFALSQAMRSRDDDERGWGGNSWVYALTVFFLEIIFTFLGMMVVAWFSRYREFKADAGSARIAGRQPMIGALRRLSELYDYNEKAAGNEPAMMKSFKISGQRSGWLALLSTHPPLSERIRRLEQTMPS